ANKINDVADVADVALVPGERRGGNGLDDIPPFLDRRGDRILRPMRCRSVRRSADHSSDSKERCDRLCPRARLFQSLATRKSERADQTGDLSMSESRPAINYFDPRPESKIGKVRT